MKPTILRNSYRVEFRHPRACHPTWGYVPEHSSLSLPQARAAIRQHREFEDGKSGGFQQRIVRIQEAVIA